MDGDVEKVIFGWGNGLGIRGKVFGKRLLCVKIRSKKEVLDGRICFFVLVWFLKVLDLN